MKPTLIAAAAIPLALAACSSSPPATPTTPTALAPTSPSAAPSSAAPTHASAPAPARPSATAATPTPLDTSGVGRIGSKQGVTLPTGVTVAIPNVVGYSLPKGVGSGSGIMRYGDTEAVLTVIVKNGSRKPVDASLLAVTLIASGEQADGMDYSEIPTNNIGGTILPGRTARGTYGFVVRKGDKGKLQAEVWVAQAEPHAILTEGNGGT